MGEERSATLERIHEAAKKEFLEKGFLGASLRTIVKLAGVTTGAFYGTRFAGMADEMAEIETKATHDYQDILEGLGRPSPRIDPRLEHILITGMFNAFFELIIHEMPLHEAENYLAEMRAFYTAGWMKIMGQ